MARSVVPATTTTVTISASGTIIVAFLSSNYVKMILFLFLQTLTFYTERERVKGVNMIKMMDTPE